MPTKEGSLVGTRELFYHLMIRLLDLLEESVLFSGLITIGIIGTMCVLALRQQSIPDVLTNTALIIVGFFFGAKTSMEATRERTSMRQDEERSQIRTRERHDTQVGTG